MSLTLDNAKSSIYMALQHQEDAYESVTADEIKRDSELAFASAYASIAQAESQDHITDELARINNSLTQLVTALAHINASEK